MPIVRCDTCRAKLEKFANDIHRHNFCSRKCHAKWMEGRPGIARPKGSGKQKAMIYMRLSEEEKAMAEREARRMKTSVSDWLRMLINAAAVPANGAKRK